MIYREFKSAVHVISDTEVGELMRWAQRHSLKTYGDIMERLVFIHAMQSEHKCDDQCVTLNRQRGQE